MKTRLPVLIWSACLVIPMAGDAAEWFVAPGGNDAWSGTVAAVGVNDGPFATFQRARDAVREKKSAGDPGPHTVNVRGGVYSMRDALVLEARDSGEPGAPVVWQAYGAEKPVISGAVTLEGWSAWKGRIQRAPLGESAKRKGGIRQALLDGSRQTLARYPNADPAQPVSGGWAFAEGKGWPMYADIPGEDKHSLEVSAGDLRRWERPQQVEIVVFPRYNWWNNRVRVQSVDDTERKVMLAADCTYAIRKGDRYFFQNALEELDCAGEWFADLEGGMFYFWPPEGRKASDARVVVAQSLLRLERGTHDIVWRGFVMEGCDAAAVTMTETNGCVVESCWIRAVGDWNGHGVSVSNGVNNRVAYCTIEQVGNTGVSLRGGDVATLTEANNLAEHNEISHFGLYYKQGVGVSLSGVGNRALHNHIHHGPRFGVLHSGNRNEIAWNHIHDVCLETEDTGAIYSGGRDWTTPRGTSISYNFIHDIPGFSMHGGKAVSPNFAWGIYLDDNSGGVDVIGNIVARCGRGGMHGHGARDCVVRNNIFVGSNDWQVDFHGWLVQQSFWERHLPTMAAGYEAVAGKPEWKGMRGMDLHPSQVPLPGGFTMRGNVFEKNIVVSDKAEVPVLSVLRVPFTHNTFNSNLYWAPGGVVRTGFKSAGPDQGADLLSGFEGAPDSLPKGWRWNLKPGGQPKVGVNLVGSAARFVLSCEDAPDKKVQPLVSGPDLPLEPGATYRLRARLRASVPGRAGVGVHSYVSKVYYWMSPKADVEVGVEWTDYEWVFEVPSPGKPGWHEQMKNFAPRIGWRVNNGALEVEGMHLHKVEPISEWDSWKANGVDALSQVADPQWADAKLFTLRPESPAWKLGFERIPVEKIGPQPKSPASAGGL